MNYSERGNNIANKDTLNLISRWVVLSIAKSERKKTMNGIIEGKKVNTEEVIKRIEALEWEEIAVQKVHMSIEGFNYLFSNYITTVESSIEMFSAETNRCWDSTCNGSIVLNEEFVAYNTEREDRYIQVAHCVKCGKGNSIYGFGTYVNTRIKEKYQIDGEEKEALNDVEREMKHIEKELAELKEKRKTVKEKFSKVRCTQKMIGYKW